MSHTPGPWVVVEETLGYPSWMVHPPYSPGIIAQHLKIEADAHLIAAAPDLLDALRALMLVTEDVFDETPNEWTRARAVVAKATGKLA